MRAFLVVALIAAASAAELQSPRVVTGRVVHALTKAPLRGAIVSAPGARWEPSAARAIPASLTGDDGGFVLHLIADRPPALIVTKTGYLDAQLTPTPALTGEPPSVVEIALLPAASISGRVLDPSGDPVPGAYVHLVPAGEAKVTRARSAMTDDRGWYVVDDLDAGTYDLAAGRNVVAAAAQLATPQIAAIPIDVGEAREGAEIMVGWDPPLHDMPVQSSGQRGRAPITTTGTGTISGTVRNVVGRGVSHVLVIVMRSDLAGDAATWSTTTDERGAYAVERLPAESFSVLAVRGGGWAMAFGAVRPNVPGAPVLLADGEQRRNVDIVLREAASIGGTIRDESGDPVRANVTLFVTSFSNGLGGALSTRTTDDRGRYRFSNLTPGQYVVMAVRSTATPALAPDGAGGTRLVGAATMFYPNVPSLSLASLLTLQGDSALDGIDFTAPYEPVADVDVTVADAGVPITALSVARTSVEKIFGPGSSVRTENGATLPGVPGGVWLLMATATAAMSTGPETLFAQQEIVTDGGTRQSVALTLEPGARLSGRVAFDGTAPLPASCTVSLLPRDPAWRGPRIAVNAASAAPNAGLAFELRGVTPGTYLIQAVDKPADTVWRLARATMNGQDVLDLPVRVSAAADLSGLVLTLSDRVTELSGVVTDAAGRRIADAEIVVVAADQRYHWAGSRRLRQAITEHDGRYVIRGLPAGTYRIGVPSRALMGSALFQFPREIAPLATVTLADGERKVQDVTIVR